eukprot:Opistho-2@6549
MSVNATLKPAERRGHSAFVHGDTFMVFGGCSGINYYADLWAFDATSMHWTSLSTTNTPFGRCFHASAIVGSKLYVFGGVTSQIISDDLWTLDLNTRVWQLVSPSGNVPPPLTGPAMATVNSTLYLFGGLKVNSAINSVVFAFDIASQQWRSIAASGTAPNPAYFASALSP